MVWTAVSRWDPEALTTEVSTTVPVGWGKHVPPKVFDQSMLLDYLQGAGVGFNGVGTGADGDV